jgi:hypothetical protein
MPDETKETKQKWEVGGLCIPAGLFIGMGLGWLFGHLVQGLLIGLGVGFLGMLLVRLRVG